MRRVFVHGFAQSPASWDAVIRPAEADGTSSRTCTLTLPGHAHAPMEVGDWDGAAHWLAQRLPERVHLIGYSMGGRLALAAALEAPEKIAALTVLGAHPGIADPHDRAARADADDELAAHIALRGTAWFCKHWEERPIFATQKRLSEEIRGRQRRIRRRHRAADLAAALRALGPGRMPDLRPRLAELGAPVTLVAGELDPRYRRIAGDMAPLFADARVGMAPDCGHNPVLEAPAWVRDQLEDAEARVP